MKLRMVVLCLGLAIFGWVAERTLNIRSHQGLADTKTFAIYAAMAEQVYFDLDQDFLNQWEAEREEDDYGLVIPDFPLGGVLKGWFRSSTYGDNDSGLAYSIIYRQPENSEHWEVVIAFRGTEFTELNDWKSNIRGVIPQSLRLEDQYDLAAAQIIDDIDMAYDYFGPDARYVSTGHSLGGGLAQLAARVHPWISSVYTFNTSPVVGNDVLSDRRNEYTVYSLYERGEVLQYVRDIFQLVGIKDSLATLKSVEVDHASGGPVQQHSIRSLVQHLSSISE